MRTEVEVQGWGRPLEKLKAMERTENRGEAVTQQQAPDRAWSLVESCIFQVPETESPCDCVTDVIATAMISGRLLFFSVPATVIRPPDIPRHPKGER